MTPTPVEVLEYFKHEPLAAVELMQELIKHEVEMRQAQPPEPEPIPPKVAPKKRTRRTKAQIQAEQTAAQSATT
jgi:hypothetical protein